MKTTKYYLHYGVLVLISLITVSCANEAKENKTTETVKEVTTTLQSNCPEYIAKQKNNNLNISILLDLSDRIEDQKVKPKDSAYLSSLAKVFVNHVKNKKVVLLEDKMQLFFNPEPSNEAINNIAENLKIAFTKDTSKDDLKKATELYSKYPVELYEYAEDDAKEMGGYPGSDIWRFFKGNVKDYCIDDCHRNILVILTDGYMYYNNTVINEGNKTSYLTPNSLGKLKLNSSNWKQKIKANQLGFIPATNHLNDLEVLVIGITSNNSNHYAQDIIETYWSNWFDAMGVKKHKIKNAGLPSNIEKVIADFIQKQ